MGRVPPHPGAQILRLQGDPEGDSGDLDFGELLTYFCVVGFWFILVTYVITKPDHLDYFSPICHFKIGSSTLTFV